MRISVETAKLAQTKGFDPRQLFVDNIMQIGNVLHNGNSVGLVHQSELQEWLRNIHHIDIVINPKRAIRCEQAEGYFCIIYTPNEEMFDWELGGAYKTYEEALEVALFEALKISY